MIHWIHKRINKSFGPKKLDPANASPGVLGFHGDIYMRNLACDLLSKSNYYIETGTHQGETLYYVGDSFSSLPVLACEPDSTRFSQATELTSSKKNVTIHNIVSQELLKILQEDYQHWFGQVGTFFLDAHGYGFEWPLKEELAFITKHFKGAYILIDDFLVPGHPNFGYDVFNEHVCSHEYVRESLDSNAQWRLFYPKYWRRTSNYHPLRGWGLYALGDAINYAFPDLLCGQFWEYEG